MSTKKIRIYMWMPGYCGYYHNDPLMKKYGFLMPGEWDENWLSELRYLAQFAKGVEIHIRVKGKYGRP